MTSRLRNAAVPTKNDLVFILCIYLCAYFVFILACFAHIILKADKGKKQIKEKVNELLKLISCEGLGKRFPSQLSGGQKQRAAAARAIITRPKLLLADEPTGALDYNTGKLILSLLQDACRKNGMTVIVITHNQALTAMADRVIKVKNGRITSNVVNENPVNVDTIEW